MNFDISIKISTAALVRITNFNIEPGKINFLFGESGIGKTLISKTIFGLLSSEEYTIIVNDQSYAQYVQSDICKLFQHHGYFVFQEPSSHLYPLMTIEDQLKQGSSASLQAIHEISSFFWNNQSGAVSSIMPVYPLPNRPSGGEKQRLFLIMAFIRIKNFIINNLSNKSLFVFDEPTAYLDMEQRNLFLKYLFDHYRQKPFTSLIITHDYSNISEVTKRHPDLTSNINYSELRRGDSGLSVNPFDPNRYIAWINNQEHDSSIRSNDETVVSLKSGFKIFNRRIYFFRSDGSSAEGLTIDKGEMVYLKGPSGIGKTSVAKMICGLVKGKDFQFQLLKHPLNDATPQNYWKNNLWGRKMTMVFQHADEALNPNATVENIFFNLPLKPRLSMNQVVGHLRMLFDQSITREFLRKKIRFLSGGEKQRLNLLRVFALDVPFVIFDEPFNGLDFDSVCKVMSWLRKLRETQKSILIISHNEDLISRLVPESSVYHIKAE
jgi:ABC-type glutathione transport system ATPase component